MNGYLTSLTAEQEQSMRLYRDNFIKRGLSTEPADREKAEAIIDDVYGAADLSPPAIKIWLDSPFQGAIGAEILNRFSKFANQSGNQIGGPVRKQVWKQVSNQAMDKVGEKVGDQVMSQVRAKVMNHVWWQVSNQVMDKVGEKVGDQVMSQFGNQVCGDSLHNFWKFTHQHLFKSMYGQYDIGWLSTYEFFMEETDVSGLDNIRPLIELSKTCGWVWPFEGAVIFTERPKYINRDSGNRLHCENGPAVQYPDGWSVYALRGVRVPETWILEGVPDAQTLLHWEDMEQRIVGCDLLGWDKIIDQLDTVVIDEDSDPIIGSLIEVKNMPDVSGSEYYLKAICGTGRVVCINVTLAVTEDGCRTALEAGANTYRIPTHLYKLSTEIRT